MNDYKQLTFNPEDPIKESWFSQWWWSKRHTKFYSFIIDLRYPFYSFFRKLKNLIRWLPIIWNDTNWDGETIFPIIKHKFEILRKEIVQNGFVSDIDTINRDMGIAIKLLDLIYEEYYCLEYQDFRITKDDINPNCKFEECFIEVSNSYDDYFKKYKSSVRAINKKLGKLPEENILLALMVAEYNQQKAERLLYKIMLDRLHSWWD